MPPFYGVNRTGSVCQLPRPGEIKACRDEDNDGYYEKVTTFVSYPGAWHAVA